ncbi:hypothetical protein PCL_11842 [Purpureocillium lilacinum]|uniref:Uncharacterized protein n=1 Tax=Purpureocillium lilacinum TaxID=33203 RepID=A0A2U3EB63_PURLI|nr:hypothetical protein PCL_11842 [Purpureocillium lilacinum]
MRWPTPRALLRQPPNLPDWMDGGGGGGDTQFAPTWDARIAAGICWCRAAWHSTLQGCRNGGQPDGSGLDGIAGLNWMVWAVGRDGTTGFAARAPSPQHAIAPTWKAGRLGWAGWAGRLGSWGSGVEEGLEAEPSGARFSSTRDASSVKIP